MALATIAYREHAPCPALRPHVRVLWELQGPCDDPAPQKLLPDGSMSLWLNFGAPIRGGENVDVVEGGAALLGEIRRPIEVSSSGALDIVGVTFWPGHARAFLDATLPELVGRVVGDAPFNVRLDPVVAADPVDRIARLQEALLDALRPARAPSAPIRRALSLLHRDDDVPDIVTLASSLGLSTRQLERRFNDELGASPKQMASVLRFRRALDALSTLRTDFSTIAYDCGYADQAHFIREFTRYAGVSPGRFVVVEAPRTHDEWLTRPPRAP